ncbi:hypothetical protein PP178_03925 [Zeaxanthinibacter sp. PT1]|uniref:hypothetical protein n=1 Tax=Zeaxanthinibacter TaxID=561554 RepID=UPI0023493260|nr:hypothetical protein [Zeaxanthinibacter sp. PT1]MDC6350688.1 hypothetical protein [Zeaxanthinibacter sp. PT1]
MAFDSTLYTNTKARVQTFLAQFADTELCGCDQKTTLFVNKLMVLLTGIDLDLRYADDTEATTKLDLLIRFLDGGKDYDCGCK